ncbi:KIAA0226 [Bugula neritina]|uniref:KIAA0226 n=1 Tax=Bugula neritina TaxID=10212 RepID=A0A7J7J6U5_BUGNE|nr:KIAA0226 [Bugula neritina]
MAKGFICEICNNSKDILFPFQFDKVVRCNHCHSCYHNNCYNKRNKNCPKCERIESRKLKSMAASEQTNVDIPE